MFKANGRLQALLLFGALILIFAWPLWGLGECLYPGSNLGDFPLHYDGQLRAKNYDLLDSLVQNYPMERLFQQEVRALRLPLWNPYPMLGVPVYQGQANYDFYPPLLVLHSVLSVARVHDVLTCGHLLLACLGMSFFLQRLGYPGLACIWGGLGWGLNGYLTTNMQFQGLLICLSWFPVLLGLLHVACTQGTSRYWLLSILVAGLGVGAGPVNVVWLAYATACSWAVFLQCRQQVRGRQRFWPAGLLAGALLLTAAQTLPTFSIASQSVRAAGDSGLQVANFQHFLSQAPLNFLVPDAWGNPALGFHVQRLAGGEWFYFETCCYLGVVPAVLALYGATRRKTPEEKFWMALLALQLLCLATPLFLLLCKLPFVGSIASLRTLPFSMFCLVLLSALGCKHLLANRASGMATGCALLALGLALVLLWWLPAARQFAWQIRIPFPEAGAELARGRLAEFYRWSNPCFWGPLVQLIGLSLFFVAPLTATGRVRWLLAWAALDLLFFARQFNPTDDPALLTRISPAIETLQSVSRFERVLGLGVCRPNTAASFEIHELSGYYSLLPSRASLLISGLRQSPPRFELVHLQLFPLLYPDPALLNLLNVGLVATYPGAPPPGPGWDLVDFRQLPIYRNPNVLPLVRMVNQVKMIPRQDKDLPAEFNNWREEFSEGGPVVLSSNQSAPGPVPSSAGHCRLEVWRPGFLAVEVEAGSSGWLVVGEGYFDGWTARVDGRPSAVVPANFAQMAVWVPPGSRTVELFFWPPGLTLGLTLSGGCLLVVFLGLFWTEARTKEGFELD